jgi:hypothetical protein
MRQVEFERPTSLYYPILSLYFSTIYQVFLTNERSAVLLAVQTVVALFSTIEGFCDEDLIRQLVGPLFPMLSILFVFWDPIRQHLAHKAVLGPPMLLLIGKCSGWQFGFYWRLLSPDGQLRFLDTLLSLTEPAMIAEIAVDTLGMADHLLMCSHEITWRIVSLLHNFREMRQHLTAEKIVMVLVHMLVAPYQSEASFMILFKAMTFIADWKGLFFEEKNANLVNLMGSIIPLTQRKLGEARICVNGFIH